MSPRKSSQRTSRKRQRQACLEDAAFIKPCKQRATDENRPPTPSRTARQQPCPHAKVPVSNKASTVLCRQEETSKLEALLSECINNEKGVAVYIPGQPGTGKTHTVRAVVSSLAKHDLEGPLPACILINCQDASSSLPRVCLAGVREAHSVMGTFTERGTKVLPIVAGDACKLPSSCNNTEAISEMRKFVNGSKKSAKSSKRMTILILDELDQACKTTEEAVQKIFSLSAASSSRLIVIGIANRLDLAHRVLQPVTAGTKTTATPTIISFHSYTARQLLHLLQAQYPDTFEPKALELVARRISAVSGDMRSAMAVCSSARATAARAATAALASPSAPNAASPSCGAPRSLITVCEVAAALAACKTGGGAEAQGHVKLIQALPVQQQLLVCTLAIARGGAAGAAPAASPAPTLTPTATSRSALTHTPRPAMSTARMPSGALATPPLGAARQGNLHSLLASQSATPVGGGFGLATPRPASKPVFKSFPMADDVPGMTPTSSVAAAAAEKGRGARQAAMSMEAVYRKYTGSGKEAGVAVVDWPGLEMLVGLLCETGLLEVTKGRGAKGRRGQFCKDTLVKLKVGTDDVKHALASSHLLLPLVAQLP